MKTDPSRKAYDLTAAELEDSSLSRLTDMAGYSSLKSLLNDHNLWSLSVGEVEKFLNESSDPSRDENQ